MQSKRKLKKSIRITEIVIVVSLLLIWGGLVGFGTTYVFVGEKLFGWQNPDFQEMHIFIEIDKTDTNEYNFSSDYVCEDFSKDLIKNARLQGYRAGYVHIEAKEGNGHAIVAFQTIDEDLYFVEPQTDDIFTVGEMDRMADNGVYTAGRFSDFRWFDMVGYSISWYKVTTHTMIPLWSN